MPPILKLHLKLKPTYFTSLQTHSYPKHIKTYKMLHISNCIKNTNTKKQMDREDEIKKEKKRKEKMKRERRDEERRKRSKVYNRARKGSQRCEKRGEM